MTPDVYLQFLLPRLRGDADVVQLGTDAATRTVVMEFLDALVKGTKPTLLPAHFENLIVTLTDPFVIDPDSILLSAAALDVIISLLAAMEGRGLVP